MNVNFLFMDESCSHPVDTRGTYITSLTGVLVPVHEYAVLRTQFYDLMNWSTRPDDKTINLHVPELHGKELLPGEDDNRKLETLDGIVDLVINNNLQVYRTGCYVTKFLQSKFKGDENLFGHCWFGFLFQLEPLIEKEMIIPIMDGLDSKMVRIYSQMVKSIDVMRSADGILAPSIKHTENILGEVFYGDSQYSIFIQVADIISWLRHLADLSNEEIQLTPYKQLCLKISRKLDNSFEGCEIRPINFDGALQVPVRS